MPENPEESWLPESRIRREKERKDQEKQRVLQRKAVRRKAEEGQKEREEQRVQKILSHVSQWGNDTCQLLLEQKISIGMTFEMVTLALGAPTSMDKKVVFTNGQKFRWVYGIPRQGATYIWFRDGQVTKIKQ